MNPMHASSQMGEHGQMRRGGSRGRGGYGGGLLRPPMHQQPHGVNTQITPTQSLKRGAPGGPVGPKRGRYESGPYSQRPPAPKYHQQPQHMTLMPQTNYSAPPHQSAPAPTQR